MRRWLRRRATPTMSWRARIVTVAAVLGITMLLSASAALADPGSPASGAISALDRTDSKGIWVSQYGLEFDDGGRLGDPTGKVIILLLEICWQPYRWGVAFTSKLLDFILGFEWLEIFIKPLGAISTRLHDHVLQPLGMTDFGQGGVLALILTVSVGAGLLTFLRGQTARGIGQAATASVMAALAVGVFASPLAAVVGDDQGLAAPIKKVQLLGSESANLIVTGTVPDTDVAAEAAPPKVGQVYLDAMLRPIHQNVAWGRSIDRDDKRCAAAYDATLKGGPYQGNDAKPRDQMAECDKAYGAYAKAPSMELLFTLNVFALSGNLLALLTIVFAFFLALSMMSVAFSAFKLMFSALWGILPKAQGPMLRDLLEIVVGLLYVVTSMSVLAMVLAMIKGTLEATANWPMLISFVLVDLLLGVGIVGIIWNYVLHRKGKSGLMKKLAERLNIKQPKPTGGQRAIQAAGGLAKLGAKAAISAPLGGTSLAAGAAAKVMANAKKARATKTASRLSRQTVNRQLTAAKKQKAADAVDAGDSASTELEKADNPGGVAALLAGGSKARQETQIRYRLARAEALERRRKAVEGKTNPFASASLATTPGHITGNKRIDALLHGRNRIDSEFTNAATGVRSAFKGVRSGNDDARGSGIDPLDSSARALGHSINHTQWATTGARSVYLASRHGAARGEDATSGNIYIDEAARRAGKVVGASADWKDQAIAFYGQRRHQSGAHATTGHKNMDKVLGAVAVLDRGSQRMATNSAMAAALKTPVGRPAPQAQQVHRPSPKPINPGDAATNQRPTPKPSAATYQRPSAVAGLRRRGGTQ